MVRLRLKPASSLWVRSFRVAKANGVTPFADQCRGMLVQTRRIAVVSSRLGVLKSFDFGVCDQDDDHASLVAKCIEMVQDFAPVGEGMGVTAGVAAIDFFDRIDAVLLAELVPDKPFQPIERVDDDRLVVVLFLTQRSEGRDDLVVGSGQGKLVAVDFIEAIFGLDEDRLGGLGAEGALADSFDSVTQDAGWFGGFSMLD